MQSEILMMIVESHRLYIRQFSPADAEQLFNIYSDKEAMKFRGSKPLQEPQEAKIMIDNAIEKINSNTAFRYAVVEKKSGKLIGTFLYKPIESFTCEVGYSFGKKYWGYGYGFETLTTMTNFLFNKGIKSILATTKKENIASIRLLEKVGFQLIPGNVYCLHKSSYVS